MGHLGGATVTTAAGPPLPRAAAMVCLTGVLPVHRQPGGEELMVFWGCCRRLPGPLSLSHEPFQARGGQALPGGCTGTGAGEHLPSSGVGLVLHLRCQAQDAASGPLGSSGPASVSGMGEREGSRGHGNGWVPLCAHPSL